MAKDSRTHGGTGVPARSSLTRWLVDPGRDVPESIREGLFNSLYGSLPIFLGGIANTLIVAAAIAWQHPTPLFIGWALFELLLAAIRLPLVMAGLRAIRAGRPGPSDLYIFCALLWAGSVGFGAFIAILYADWVAATLACLSAAAMVGGICFRNFAAPRLVGAMIVLSLGPCMVAGILSGQPILLVTGIQIPMYLVAMSNAAYRMNRMLVERMEAEEEKERRASEDSLTRLLNRSGLAAALERRGERGDDAFLFLDLDGFKQINDTLGHAAGDALLVAVAGRLRALAGEDDLAVRLGGDEFLIVARADSAGAARALGARAIDALCSPYLLGESAVEIGVSVGIALAAEHGADFPALIEAADAALYQAKARGRCQCVIATAGPRLAATQGRRALAAPAPAGLARAG